MPPIRSRVALVRPEAPRAVTIRLEFDDPFDYKPGQAVEIDPKQFPALEPRIRELEETKGFPEMARAFSIASHPGERRFIDLGVKVEESGPYPPLLTPYLTTQLKAGDELSFAGPVGSFTLPDPLPAHVAGLLHIAAGSGVVPIRGIIRFCLAEQRGLRHLLLLQNRTEENIFYRDEWRALEQRHPNVLKVVHVLSRVGEDWPGRRGYLDRETIEPAMNRFLTPHECLAFVCGPNRPGARPGFMDKFAGVPRRKQPGVLGELGIPFERIKTEMW